MLIYQVYSGWKDIAEIVRSRVFKEDEQHLIDIFDIQVLIIVLSLWLFLQDIYF